MITETKRTCSTCPFARQIEGNKYSCSATHNLHNSTVRGHWEATADCERAIEDEEQLTQDPEDNRGSGRDDEYVMTLEASLEQSEIRATQQQRYSQIVSTTLYGIEVDSIKPDSFRVWAGSLLLGTMRRTSRGWMVRQNNVRSWYDTPDEAQHAVVAAALPY